MANYKLGPVIGKIGGAEVEEIPVSMSGTGIGARFPLVTVDAGDGAHIFVSGEATSAPSGSWSSELLISGQGTDIDGAGRYGWGQKYTGTIDIEIISGHNSATTAFTGTVYVIRS